VRLQEAEVPVTQTTEEQAVGAQEESQAAGADGATFDAAVSEFLAYLQGYRHYSSWTVGAYRIDLREFRGFLLDYSSAIFVGRK
jgi:hypothetical protein